MNITEDTKANAQAVYDFIIMNPDKHDQNSWIHVEDENFDGPYDEDAVNVCGTTMCIAGTAAFLAKGEINVGTVTDDAEGFLGLTADEGALMFYTYNNEQALDMLNAVAQGDPDKFRAIKADDSYTYSIPGCPCGCAD